MTQLKFIIWHGLIQNVFIGVSTPSTPFSHSMNIIYIIKKQKKYFKTNYTQRNLMINAHVDTQNKLIYNLTTKQLECIT